MINSRIFTDDQQAKIDAQRLYCRLNDLPHFAHDRCAVCGRSWAEDARITLEMAGWMHIICCPFCNRSWCG